MSFNGLAASFLPFTINGLTDATFSNSNIGNAIATTLQLTSATPLKLARFNADRELVSASVDESQVALLVGNNVFNGSQTILPGTSTNINNVIKTAITAEAYTEADFTTSGISGYTAPLGTLSGPTAGEYSIGQTANDRTIMKINGFVPTEKTWVYSFMIRIVDVAEAYLSVEQSGVQRSSTLRLITSELTTVSDTFTYDPTSGPIVFKIYTNSLDPWNASWSSFTLGSYTAAITAPLSAPLVATTISTTTIGTEILAFPLVSSVNSEAWSVYAISTMGDPSSLGGLIFQEATLGVGAYITGGVVGATSFRFNTISGDAGKVVVTNGDQVMSTSISAGQLQYITGLTSQAANSITTGTNKITQQYNATTGAGDVSTLVNRGTLDAALALVPNLLPLANTWTGSYNQFNGTVSTMGTNKFIQPYNALVTDVSTCVNRATLDASIAGLGAGILNLNNNWTGTNAFYSTLTTAVGQTTSINGALTTSLDDLGFTSASFTTAGITGAYTPPLGTITNPSGSTYQITQTAQARSIMAISGFTPSVGITYVFQFNINCTIGTATISVEQNNILRSPALYQLTTGFNKVVGSFTYDGTPNTVVFKIYAGIASWNAQWDSFVLSTYSIGMNANMNALTVNNRFTQRYNALATDVSTLVNRATMDSAISAGSIVNLNNIFIGTNAFNNDVSLGVSTVVVNQQSITTSILQTSGISSQALGGTAVISGTYLLTPTPTTFSYASVYSPSQTFLANAKFNYLFTGFTSPIFGVSLTVYQANVANTGFVAISSTVPVVVGTFSGIFTPNINSSFLGQVYFTFSGINSKTVGWTAFTYQRGMETVNGNLTVNGDTNTSTITVGATSFFNKTGGNSGANFYRVAGNDAGSSPYTEYYFNNLRRCFMGNAGATEVQIACENNAQLNIYTAGSSRMVIKTTGDRTHTAGDSSYIRYGPNSTWSAYLTVGATPDRSGASNAQVITTNGNLHLDGGNSNDIYYGYYPFSRGSNNTHRFYGNIFLGTAPAYISGGGTALSYSNGSPGQITRSNVVQRSVWYSNSSSWAGGVNATNAFYKSVASEPVKLTGRFSHYVGGQGMSYPYIRIYSQSAGVYSYYSLQCYFNVTYNHTPQPIDLLLQYSDIPYTGWFDVYFYNGGGCITDSNDFLWINATNLISTGY